MKEYIIPIPMYNGTLHLVDCKDTKHALMEIKGGDYNDEGDNTEACLFWNHEKNSANWWLCIDLEDSKMGVLVHELFHATHRILEYFGVEFTSKNHEPFAYLMEYLYNECVKNQNKQNMKTEEQLVVTFTCNNHVHVYDEKSGVLPMSPYKTHSSIEAAIKYLKETRNVNYPEIIVK